MYPEINWQSLSRRYGEQLQQLKRTFFVKNHSWVALEVFNANITVPQLFDQNGVRYVRVRSAKAHSVSGPNCLQGPHYIKGCHGQV